MTDFYIREARPGDVQTILDLILELAIYEKAPEQVKATPEIVSLIDLQPQQTAFPQFGSVLQLLQNLFKSPSAYALLAFSASDEPIGFALYFFNFSTWTGRPGIYLEDIYVKEAFRKLGIGKALFGQLGKIAQEKECPRVDWSVLKWNQPSIDFYEKALDATRMEEWLGMRLEGDRIRNLDKFLIPNVAPNSV
ncbi:acyl-CoA N-acyltransferase [Thelephora ganbajun]|uniref:Acyl-CoA N-acyltransferase n=1 Tax=Thelephora ganbajun TaxID=370292 RepID=A0ACB6ZVU9_THEGA|nr:acyl-CoA N-acyltransferase [Thelephora ganbajun]